MPDVSIFAPTPPRVRLCIGVTGHREDNAAFTAQRIGVAAALTQVLDLIDAATATAHAAGSVAATRLHTLLADGADQIAADEALARGWDLVAPLPFGLAVNIAINAQPSTAADARLLLAADEARLAPGAVRDRARRIRELATRAQLFELADRDEAIAELYLATLEAPADPRLATTFAAECSLRVALAGQVMIEQCDLLIGIWDGATRALVGGTGHTIQAALEMGAPVVWIDANAPAQWRVLAGPEAAAGISGQEAATTDRTEVLQRLVREALQPAAARKAGAQHGRHAHPGAQTLTHERWPVHSRPLWHAYRRIEALFGDGTLKTRFRNLRQTYETPASVCTGSAAGLLQQAGALPGQEPGYADKLESAILRRFCWADGVSARLSDVYRGSMTTNFLLAPLAIVGGIAYLPFASSHDKWVFALFELALLMGILAFTIVGQKKRWHGRWFETRRVAEYLRHAPILLLLGVARPPGRWPVGTETSWPEWYARHVLREVGLPRVAITRGYLHSAVGELLHEHVVRQRDYHRGKSARLAAVQHNLDRCSEILFLLAVIAVAGYLLLKGGGVLHLWPLSLSENLSYAFTFLGVLFPTFGGALAGIRYFGDFERFSAISSVTAEKLHAVHLRILQLLAAPEGALDYQRASDLAHAADEVVVNEIESWQAVFGGKHVTVPV